MSTIPLAMGATGAVFMAGTGLALYSRRPGRQGFGAAVVILSGTALAWLAIAYAFLVAVDVFRGGN